MSNKERCLELLDRIDEEALCAVVALLEKIDEDLDMEFCIALYDEAVANDDGQSVSAEDLKAKYGI